MPAEISACTRELKYSLDSKIPGPSSEAAFWRNSSTDPPRVIYHVLATLTLTRGISASWYLQCRTIQASGSRRSERLTQQPVVTRYRCHTYHGDGNGWRMRQDELDLIEPLAPSPELNRGSPAVTRVTETMREDDGSGVAANGREHDWASAPNGSHRWRCDGLPFVGWGNRRFCMMGCVRRRTGRVSEMKRPGMTNCQEADEQNQKRDDNGDG